MRVYTVSIIFNVFLNLFVYALVFHGYYIIWNVFMFLIWGILEPLVLSEILYNNNNNNNNTVDLINHPY